MIFGKPSGPDEFPSTFRRLAAMTVTSRFGQRSGEDRPAIGWQRVGEGVPKPIGHDSDVTVRRSIDWASEVFAQAQGPLGWGAGPRWGAPAGLAAAPKQKQKTKQVVQLRMTRFNGVQTS